MIETSLHRNPFAILGATTRDGRARIIQLTEERSLSLSEETLRKAQAELTNPRTRLAAELGWLPGVSPNKAQQLLADLANALEQTKQVTQLPVLASLNVTSAAFEQMDPNTDAQNIIELISRMAQSLEGLAISDLIRDINEDRAVAGFPEIRTTDQVEAELDERKRHYRATIKQALDHQPPKTLVQIMTSLVGAATNEGDRHAPAFIDDLVDSYALEAQDFLQKEGDNISSLLLAVREGAASGEGAIKGVLDQIEAVVRNWDMVAQPIQLSAKARGIRHEPSRELAYAIRELAIDLFNSHDLPDSSKRLMDLVHERFSELPEVLERVEEDRETLVELLEDRRQTDADREQWEADIKYQSELGIFSKKQLSISVGGASFGSQHFPLETITRLRWGGIRHSVNGIPTGTSLTVAFGDQNSEAVVELRNKEVFAAVTEKLWLAVGLQIMRRIGDTLKRGGELRLGDALLRDDGIVLMRHKFFGSAEAVPCTWADVQVWSADGSFCIGSTRDKRARIALSYIEFPNTHIFEALIRAAFKRPGLKRLSELF